MNLTELLEDIRDLVTREVLFYTQDPTIKNRKKVDKAWKDFEKKIQENPIIVRIVE